MTFVMHDLTDHLIVLTEEYALTRVYLKGRA